MTTRTLTPTEVQDAVQRLVESLHEALDCGARAEVTEHSENQYYFFVGSDDKPDFALVKFNATKGMGFDKTHGWIKVFPKGFNERKKLYKKPEKVADYLILLAGRALDKAKFEEQEAQKGNAMADALVKLKEAIFGKDERAGARYRRGYLYLEFNHTTIFRVDLSNGELQEANRSYELTMDLSTVIEMLQIIRKHLGVIQAAYKEGGS